MQQVIQNYRTGALGVVDVPAPRIRPGSLLIRTAASVVSAGTERRLVELAQKSLLGKALARPDLVRRILDKARTDGLSETLQQVTHRLDTPIPLGYSCTGEVLAVGDGVSDFRVGDSVACGGQGVAIHAEVVCVPRTLAVPVPAGVTPAEAAFGMVGAIALHGVRLLRVGAGDVVVVIGLGLLGLLSVQVLRASGCRVVGLDLSAEKVGLARTFGAEVALSLGDADPVPAVRAVTQRRGADGILIMAGTPSNEPIELAARLGRERGRIVATGLVGLNIPRQLFFEKELEFLVSRSSGPGLYDPEYEGRGRDYPAPYVRWTHGRNMAQFLHMVSTGEVRVDTIITHRFPIERAPEAYAALTESRTPPCIGVVLEYPRSPHVGPSIIRLRPETVPRQARETIRLGLIGAGLFARTTMLPELQRLGRLEFRGVAAASGGSAYHVANKFGFAYATTDAQEVIADPDVDCVLILTRHHLHARFVVEALKAGKDVFVEKPLALSCEALREIVTAWRETRGRVMVGFNRRHSPHATAARRFLAGRGGPIMVTCRVNAGDVPAESWVNDPVEGGGRILGEVCHFMDLVQFLAGARTVRVQAGALVPDDSSALVEDVAATLELADGSVASVCYTARGHRSLARERIEAFSGGSACLIDNFRTTRFFGPASPKTVRSWRLDRGYRGELTCWIEALRGGGPPPVPFGEYVAATLATLALAEAVKVRGPVEVDLRLLEQCQREEPQGVA